MLRLRPLAIALVLAGIALPAAAGTPIHQVRELAADGRLSVSNVAGRITVRTWDKPQVELGGTLGEGVEKLVIEGDAKSLRIEVRHPQHGNGWFGWGGAKMHVEPTILELRVPRRAALDLEAVSADVDVADTFGRRLSINAVSGDIKVAGSAPGEANVESVSGDLDLRMDSSDVDAQTVSGDLVLGGALNGDVKVESVSGNVVVGSARALRRLDANTVSGDLDLKAALEPSASVNVESVSGTVQVAFPAGTGARIHAETFSGDIRSPVGHVEEEDHGPGSSLDARLGDGRAEVKLESFSGDIRIETP